VPDLSSSGYRFMGGRLVATPHGPAVLFMYDDPGGTRLVLYTRGMTVDRNMPMSRHARDGLEGVAWSNQGVGYTLVGPSSSEIRPLADEVRGLGAPGPSGLDPAGRSRPPRGEPGLPGPQPVVGRPYSLRSSSFA